MKRNRDLARSLNSHVSSKWLLPSRLAARFTRFKPARFTLIFLLAASVASPSLLWLQRVEAATILDPNNPGGLFQTEGTQPFTTGTTFLLKDASKSDFIVFFAFDNDAAAGTECDVIATFRVTAVFRSTQTPATASPSTTVSRSRRSPIASFRTA